MKLNENSHAILSNHTALMVKKFGQNATTLKTSLYDSLVALVRNNKARPVVG